MIWQSLEIRQQNFASPYMFKTSIEAFRILSEVRIYRIKTTFAGTFCLPLINS